MAALDYYDPTSSGNIDPNTGLDIQNPVSNSTPTTDPTIDPTTGLPYPQGRTAVNNPAVVPSGGFDTSTTPPAPTPYTAPGTIGGGDVNNFYPGTTLPQDPNYTTLVNTLMSRANQSLAIDPNTDPVIAPQVNNYGATQTRMARQAIDSAAESGSPYSTGAQQNAATQANEQAGFNTANLQSTLVSNELTSRRKDITDALSESGTLLTANQQLQLQQELGMIDANLKQQAQNSQNDQFLATLGLNTNNQNNYYSALYSGVLG